MQQSLAQRLGQVQAKLEHTEKEKEAAAKPKAPTFFEKHLPDIRSGETAKNYDIAKTIGQTRARAFINSTRVATHPDHEPNLDLLFNKFGGDYSKIEKHFVDACSDELGYPNPQDCIQDPAYEQRVAQQNRPQGNADKQDWDWHGILNDTLQRSRDAYGYGRDKCYDNAAIAGWKIKYRR